jgi:nicotinate-nucleotide adenylyltransferase
VARVGIFGGTFNPPHVGHLVCAQEALIGLGLERVLLMPVHAPPHKVLTDDPGPEQRAAMCEAAVAGDPRLGVSRAELERGGPSYTVDTLRTVHERTPGDELTWIMGGDMAHAFPAWREPDAILGMARLGIAEREELRRDAIERALGVLPGAAERVAFFDMPRIDVSSSLLRRRVAAGRPIRYLVPEAVREHIDREALYQ